MKKSVLLYVTLLMVSVSFFSCKPNDEKILKEVQTTISQIDPKVSSAVKDGVVTLSGTVESEQAKMAAESAVKSIKGVKSVMNNIEVKVPVVINPDDTLTTSVSTALKAGGYNDVMVAVKDGEVTLTGTVKKADLKKVMQIANEAKPKKVNNQLKLK